MSKTKPITLRAFKIKNKNLRTDKSPLFEFLQNNLKDSTLEKRVMELKKDDFAKHEDIMCDYSLDNPNYISGSILRISVSDDIPSLPADFYKKDKVVMSSLENQSGNQKTYRDHYYFMLSDTYLITDLPRTSKISRFEIYLNYLLRNVRGTEVYEFVPLIAEQPKLQLSDIKTIRVSNPEAKVGEQLSKELNISFTETVFTALKNMVVDVDDLNETLLSQLIYADLNIKFKKPKGMKDDTYKEALGVYMKSVSEEDFISLVPKKGQPINGKDILKTKSTEVEINDSGRIYEDSLNIEMQKFLEEIVNQKK